MIAIIASLFLSGAAHTNAAAPLAPRSYTGEECGVSYQSTERQECGVREYNTCPNKACPGYEPERMDLGFAFQSCSTTRACAREQKSAAIRACQNQPGRPGILVNFRVIAREEIEANCRFPELINSCATAACGDKSYHSCPNLALPFNNTCSLLMTRTEVSDYIESARSQLEVNAQLYATQKAIFLVQARTKQESACLIRDWDGKEQFEDLVNALKANFVTIYRENFDAQPYDCATDAVAPEELNFRDLRCALISQGEVLQNLNNPALEVDLRTFYGTCLTQKAYQAQERWFSHNISETTRLINDIVAAKDGQMAEALTRLKSDMEAKNVGVVP